MNWTILDTLMVVSFGTMFIGLLMGVCLKITAYINVFKEPKKVVVIGNCVFFIGLILGFITALMMRAN